MDYLYGASVQGIQEFIFRTNKLKEIIVTSQLVDNICTSEFRAFCKGNDAEVKEKNIIMSAAGNIKYLLDKDDCEKIVRSFPKHISNYAPGITISQAVVKLSGNLKKKDIDDLEERLKIQRNRADMPVDIGFMGLERARRTGGVANSLYKDKNDTEEKPVDRATQIKASMRKEDTLRLFEKFKKNVNVEDVAFDMADITKQSDNAWLAIIHADGNALGLKLQNLANKITDKKEMKNAFARFSKELDMATQEAAQTAFEEVIDKKEPNQRYPLRPVVLGGDDLTVIIRADLAFDFTKEYLNAFEKKTKDYLKFMTSEFKVDIFDKGLTACAGIAYIKESYPFHYGVHLAESLTAEAKKFSKGIDSESVPSSLSFYKVQSSFIDELESMKARTHFAKKSNISFDYGPYLIADGNNGYAVISELEEKLDTLEKLQKADSKGISKLRQWLSELHRDKSKADFMMTRIETVNKDIYQALKLESAIKNNKTILQDLIHLNTFKTQSDDDKL